MSPALTRTRFVQEVRGSSWEKDASASHMDLGNFSAEAQQASINTRFESGK